MIPCDHRQELREVLKCGCGWKGELYGCASQGECVLLRMSTGAEKSLGKRQACEICPSRVVSGEPAGLPSQKEIREMKRAHFDRVSPGVRAKNRTKETRKIEAESKWEGANDFAICRSVLNIADLETSPSIVQHHDRIYMAYEQHSPVPHLFFAELSKAWEPFSVEECRMIPVHLCRENLAGQSRPKLFVHDNEIWLHYTGIALDGALTPILGMLNHRGEIGYEIPIHFPAGKPSESEWAVWSNGGQILASYSFSPHCVMKISGLNASVETFSGSELPWTVKNCGSPVKDGDEFVCFVTMSHNGLDALTALSWEASFPYKVKKWTRRPLLMAGPDWADSSIVVGGAVKKGDKWHVSLGAGGNSCRITVIDTAAISAEMIA